jgi:hypothetical protein
LKETGEEQPLKSAEEIYIKVYIKSEADLPKIKDNYIIKEKALDYVTQMTLDPLSKCDRDILLKGCDWYLIEVSQPIKDITDLPYPNHISKHQTDINIGWIRAMKYMKNQPVKDITDEEMREYVITELKSHVVHPNPLTPSEINVLNICCNYIKNHGKI